MHAHLRTVFALSRITLDHLVACLEAREGHISHGVLLMMGLLSGDDGSEGSQGEVDTRETSESHQDQKNATNEEG